MEELAENKDVIREDKVMVDEDARSGCKGAFRKPKRHIQTQNIGGTKSRGSGGSGSLSLFAEQGRCGIWTNRDARVMPAESWGKRERSGQLRSVFQLEDPGSQTSNSQQCGVMKLKT